MFFFEKRIFCQFVKKACFDSNHEPIFCIKENKLCLEFVFLNIRCFHDGGDQLLGEGNYSPSSVFVLGNRSQDLVDEQFLALPHKYYNSRFTNSKYFVFSFVLRNV